MFLKRYLGENEDIYPICLYAIASDSPFYSPIKKKFDENTKKDYPFSIMFNFLDFVSLQKMEDIKIEEIAKNWSVELNIGYGYVQANGNMDLFDIYNNTTARIRSFLYYNDVLVPKIASMKTFSEVTAFVIGLCSFLLQESSVMLSLEHQDMINRVSTLFMAFDTEFAFDNLDSTGSLIELRDSIRMAVPIICSFDRNTGKLTNSICINSILSLIDVVIIELSQYQEYRYSVFDIKYYLDDVISSVEIFIHSPRFPKESEQFFNANNELNSLYRNINPCRITKGGLKQLTSVLKELHRILIIFHQKQLIGKTLYNETNLFISINRCLWVIMCLINNNKEVSDDDIIKSKISGKELVESCLLSESIDFDTEYINFNDDSLYELDFFNFSEYYIDYQVILQNCPIDINYALENYESIRLSLIEYGTFLSDYSTMGVDFLLLIFKIRTQLILIYQCLYLLNQNGHDITELMNSLNLSITRFNCRVDYHKTDQVLKMRYQTPTFLVYKMWYYTKRIIESLQTLVESPSYQNDHGSLAFFNNWIIFFGSIHEKCEKNFDPKFESIMYSCGKIFNEYYRLTNTFIQLIFTIDSYYSHLGLIFFSKSLSSVLINVFKFVSTFQEQNYSIDDVSKDFGVYRKSFQQIYLEFVLRCSFCKNFNLFVSISSIYLMNSRMQAYFENKSIKYETDDSIIQCFEKLIYQQGYFTPILVELRSKYDAFNVINHLTMSKWKFTQINTYETQFEVLSSFNSLFRSMKSLINSFVISNDYMAQAIGLIDFIVQKMQIINSMIKSFSQNRDNIDHEIDNLRDIYNSYMELYPKSRDFFINDHIEKVRVELQSIILLLSHEKTQSIDSNSSNSFLISNEKMIETPPITPKESEFFSFSKKGKISQSMSMSSLATQRLSKSISMSFISTFDSGVLKRRNPILVDHSSPILYKPTGRRVTFDFDSKNDTPLSSFLSQSPEDEVYQSTIDLPIAPFMGWDLKLLRSMIIIDDPPRLSSNPKFSKIEPNDDPFVIFTFPEIFNNFNQPNDQKSSQDSEIIRLLRVIKKQFLSCINSKDSIRLLQSIEKWYPDIIRAHSLLCEYNSNKSVGLYNEIQMMVLDTKSKYTIDESNENMIYRSKKIEMVFIDLNICMARIFSSNVSSMTFDVKAAYERWLAYFGSISLSFQKIVHCDDEIAVLSFHDFYVDIHYSINSFSRFTDNCGLKTLYLGLLIKSLTEQVSSLIDLFSSYKLHDYLSQSEVLQIFVDILPSFRSLIDLIIIDNECARVYNEVLSSIQYINTVFEQIQITLKELDINSSIIDSISIDIRNIYQMFDISKISTLNDEVKLQIRNVFFNIVSFRYALIWSRWTDLLPEQSLCSYLQKNQDDLNSISLSIQNHSVQIDMYTISKAAVDWQNVFHKIIYNIEDLKRVSHILHHSPHRYLVIASYFENLIKSVSQFESLYELFPLQKEYEKLVLGMHITMDFSLEKPFENVYDTISYINSSKDKIGSSRAYLFDNAIQQAHSRLSTQTKRRIQLSKFRNGFIQESRNMMICVPNGTTKTKIHSLIESHLYVLSKGFVFDDISSAYLFQIISNLCSSIIEFQNCNNYIDILCNIETCLNDPRVQSDFGNARLNFFIYVCSFLGSLTQLHFDYINNIGIHSKHNSLIRDFKVMVDEMVSFPDFKNDALEHHFHQFLTRINDSDSIEALFIIESLFLQELNSICSGLFAKPDTKFLKIRKDDGDWIINSVASLRKIKYIPSINNEYSSVSIVKRSLDLIYDEFRVLCNGTSITEFSENSITEIFSRISNMVLTFFGSVLHIELSNYLFEYVFLMRDNYVNLISYVHRVLSIGTTSFFSPQYFSLCSKVTSIMEKLSLRLHYCEQFECIESQQFEVLSIVYLKQAKVLKSIKDKLCEPNHTNNHYRILIGQIFDLIANSILIIKNCSVLFLKRFIPIDELKRIVFETQTVIEFNDQYNATFEPFQFDSMFNLYNQQCKEISSILDRFCRIYPSQIKESIRIKASIRTIQKQLFI